MVFFLVGVFSLWLFASPVYAQGTAKISDILLVLQRIIGLLAPIAVLLFFIMVVWAGFKFIRSRGDPKNLEEARHILQYAAIGAALIPAAYLLIRFIGTTTGCDVTSAGFNGCP